LDLLLHFLCRLKGSVWHWQMMPDYDKQIKPRRRFIPHPSPYPS
jgi:hypothetical protein